MGDSTNFRVNEDGSVTFCELQSTQDIAILDIFKIENAKGGVLSSLRMRRRAKQYANSHNISDYIVEKLMLEHYPNDFANLKKAKSLIYLGCLISVFLGGLIFDVYSMYDGINYVGLKCYKEIQYAVFPFLLIPVLIMLIWKFVYLRRSILSNLSE